jgi:Family of unknown function (DUF5681)
MSKSPKKSRRQNASAVGYGKPPPQHRFQPGKSGNPRGRPKSLPELSELTAKELRRRGYVTIDGKRVSVSRIELLVKQIIANAGKGSPKALGFLLEMLAKNEAKERNQAILAQGTTVHAGMTAKEAMEEYTRWFKETCSQPIFDG